MNPVGRATRLALLVAGGFAQFAVVQPDGAVPAAAVVAALLALTGSTVLGIRHPLPASTGGKAAVTARTWLSVSILVAFAVVTATHVHPRDTADLGRSLALVLIATQIGQALVLRTARDAALGCALVGVMLIVAGMFATSGYVGVALVPAVFALGVAVLLLQREHAISTADAVHVVVQRDGRKALGPAAAAGALATVAVLLVSTLTPLHSQAHFRQSSSSRPTGRSGSTTSTTSSGEVDLRNRTTPTDAPVLAISATAPPYLQGAIYDNFDGTNWTVSGAPDAAAQWTEDGGTQTAPGVSQTPNVRTDVVQVLQHSALDVVYSVGRPIGYGGSGSVLIDANGTPHFSVAAPGGGGPTRYVVTSTTPLAAPVLPPATTLGADPTGGRWTQLPADLPGRVSALAINVTATAATRAAKVQAVEGYLDAHEQYTLNSPLPAKGDDAVDDFLFVSHLGFCEQFASADVVLLRSLGIPARLVTGYAFGDTRSEPGTRIMRNEDAHAWIQVWYPGTGWVSSDPTAGAALAAADATHSSRSWTDPFPDLRQVPGGRVTLAGVIAAIGALCTVLLLRLGRRRRTRAPVEKSNPTDGPALSAFLQLNAELARTERQRAPGESLRELGIRLDDRDLLAALEVVEAESYARDGLLDPDQVRRAVQVLDSRRAAYHEEPAEISGR